MVCEPLKGEEAEGTSLEVDAAGSERGIGTLTLTGTVPVVMTILEKVEVKETIHMAPVPSLSLSPMPTRRAHGVRCTCP